MFRYFGSKASTSSKIADLVAELAPGGTIADAFGGLGTIGATLRARGHKVTTCDVLTFPHYFQIARIECKNTPNFENLLIYLELESRNDLIEILNNCNAPSSWFVTEYSKNRKFFTYSNAIKIAGAWHKIVRWNNAGLINRREKAYLVSSLLNSMDSVANTAGTYYAYLKEFHRKALRPFVFSWIPSSAGRFVGKAILGDALEALKGKTFDLLYLDPPYNERNYAGYYHLPESLSMLRKPEINDATTSGVPKIPHVGTENIRNGMTLEYIEKIISMVSWNFLIFHYCDDGLIPLDKLHASLKQFGSVKALHINALGYTTKKSIRSILHYVFVVTKFETCTARAPLSA